MQLGAGVVGSVICLALQWWWLAPVPLAASFVVYELYFWSRGDRPCRIELGDTIRVTDRVGRRDIEVSLSAIESATLHYRTHEDHLEVVAVLADRERIRAAIPFRVDPQAFTAEPWDVNADVVAAILGGMGGLVRALAPIDCVCRQVVANGDGIAWLRANLDAEVWQRVAVRAWRGQSPALDLFGYHDGPPDALLVLDGHRFALRGAAEQRGAIDFGRAWQSERSVTLFHMVGEEHDERTEAVPLLALEIGEGVAVHVPAPDLESIGDIRPQTSDSMHMHVPEGGAVLWHLLRCVPAERWPETLSTVRNLIPCGLLPRPHDEAPVRS